MIAPNPLFYLIPNFLGRFNSWDKDSKPCESKFSCDARRDWYRKAVLHQHCGMLAAFVCILFAGHGNMCKLAQPELGCFPCNAAVHSSCIQQKDSSMLKVLSGFNMLQICCSFSIHGYIYGCCMLLYGCYIPTPRNSDGESGQPRSIPHRCTCCSIYLVDHLPESTWRVRGPRWVRWRERMFFRWIPRPLWESWPPTSRMLRDRVYFSWLVLFFVMSRWGRWRWHGVEVDLSSYALLNVAVFG